MRNSARGLETGKKKGHWSTSKGLGRFSKGLKKQGRRKESIERNGGGHWDEFADLAPQVPTPLPSRKMRKTPARQRGTAREAGPGGITVFPGGLAGRRRSGTREKLNADYNADTLMRRRSTQGAEKHIKN